MKAIMMAATMAISFGVVYGMQHLSTVDSKPVKRTTSTYGSR